MPGMRWRPAFRPTWSRRSAIAASPTFDRDDERLVYDLVTEMNETRTLSQPTYDRAVALLGLDHVIELITALGFYTMVAIMLNGFDAPVPGGERPLP